MPPESPPPARAAALVDAAITTVRGWLNHPEPEPKPGTRRLPRPHLVSAERRAAILADPAGREFAMQFIDLVIGTEGERAAARQLERLSRDLPPVLPLGLRILIQLAGGFAVLLPRAVMPLVRAGFRRAVADRLLGTEPRTLDRCLAGLRERGIRVSLAPLGGAVHGMGEADRRRGRALDLLGRDDVDSVILRLGALAGPTAPWAYEEAVERTIERILPLYEFAASSPTPKQIVLETDRYEHFDLMMDVVMGALGRAALLGYEGGITLPAALPDALPALQRLSEWARARRAHGGAGITVRLVEEGLLSHEPADAARLGVPAATLPTRLATEANLVRLLEGVLSPEHAGAVRVTVATSNLFHLALAWHLARERGVSSALTVELRRGETLHLDALASAIDDLRLHAPIADDLASSSDHLIERLASETEPDGFLAAARRLGQDDALFAREAGRLGEAVTAAGEPAAQNARLRPRTIGEDVPSLNDPAVPKGREWARGALTRARASSAGRATVHESGVGEIAELNAVVAAAVAAGEDWAARALTERTTGMRDLAAVLDALRATIVETLVSETGALFAEADGEAVRAVSAAHAVAHAAAALGSLENAEFEPVPVVLAAPGWTSPVADTVEAVASALAAGSAVIVQPPHQARRSCALVIEAAREAGLPEGLVTLVVPEGADVARAALEHPDIERVVFTGDRDTAGLLRSWRPSRPPLGDAAGVASVIVTESADTDAAVDAIVRGAFARGAQDPRGARLVILVGEAGDSAAFRTRLADAVRATLPATSIEASSRMAPLATTPPERLRRLLATLDEGESWLVEPEALDDRLTLWRPGVRDGVAPEHAVNRTAPVPAVVLTRVADLEAAVELQNSAQGAVAGIHTLDVEELALWLDTVDAGTLVVNEPAGTHGRHALPSGGWRGAGGLRGSTERILTLGEAIPVFAEAQQNVRLDGIGERVRALIEAAQPAMTFLEFDLVRAGAVSDERAWVEHYRDARELPDRPGERVVVRHLPVDTTIRRAAGVSSAQFVRVLAAATRAGARVHVSTATELPERLVQLFAHPLSPLRVASVLVEGDARWHARIQSGEVETPHIRLIGGDAGVLATVLAKRPDVALHAAPVTTAGRLELLPFLRAQAVHMTAERYGRPDPMVEAIEF
ncbi:bifunctional proline dehydrogenase/L-glutamate gamma-semialdehyde dehydrogenase [Salinibacterium sp. SYSU T00001]|uniref:bifunctional proline dehydrogenase/L-glutamate gamma-semialdehyde dehydrogenase n=1 Tax=Homoserinimonas sedimenticola TaxID=2986805 RepID=UPI0022367DE0|nr:bifunctional proline dehydrogenase/L-glutamate gamma-semialdehyde dehydrogenase [Salinibacterium sedimenticola]MCW4385859.1 bifunctional proline dehydrogenase/L-glutamate gamma-semialdehyde dehydrogenase [Salinibacterium sedimenticola]